MSATALLLIAAGAVAVLLFFVIKIRMSAFVSLLIVALGTALAAGIPLAEIVPTMTKGMGNTLGSVMIVVGLGAMLGRVIEVAGGADAVAKKFTAMLGRHRVVAGVTMAAFVLGIPVFFDVGFIILAPIVFGFAKIAGINPLKLGLPVAGVMLIVHVALPPHPGPVAAAGILEVSPGTMLLIGLPISIVTAIIGFFSAKLIKTNNIKLEDSPALQSIEGRSAEDLSDVPTSKRAPSAWVVVALVLLPILQIMLGTTGTMLTEAGSFTHSLLGLVGSSVVALLVAVIVAYLVIGQQQRWDLGHRGSVLDSALPAVAVIVFVTGAGGVFANVLVTSGIGAALSDALVAINMPVILAAFLIALALRASQGSATVAILTSAGLIAAPVAQAGYTPVQATLVTLALCFGALGLSHINDSGFWIVTKYLGLTVKDGLRTWTVLSTVIGLAGFLITWALFGVVTAAGV